MRLIFRDIRFSIFQAIRYAARIRPYPILFLLLFAGAQLLWNHAFQVLGYSNLTAMAWIGAFRSLVQGGCVAALAFAISRRLLLGREVTLLGVGELFSISFLRYILLVVLLRFTAELGEIFCLFGNSMAGPGRMVSIMTWGLAGVCWILSAIYLPRLAIGLPDVTFLGSIGDMRRQASLSAGVRLAGTALLAELFAWRLQRLFWFGRQMMRMDDTIANLLWVLFYSFGQVVVVCAFTVMSCVLFWPSREQELSGLPMPPE